MEGANLPRLNREDFLNLPIPVPPLSEQERIVGLLDEADALRQRRQQADRRTAAFIPALFHEMFGDPGKKRKLVGLGELVRFVGGGTPSRACPEYFEGTIPWATSKDVKSDYMSDTQEHITEDAIEQSATNLVPARSVLIVVKSKILMHSLPIAITTVPMCFGQDLKALICGEKALPEFIVGCLSSQKQSILAKARGANTEGLTLEILRSVLIPLPPVRLQREFAERVGEVRALETAQAQSRQRLDALFAALLDRAFKGRL
jgi:type I restriction enzyme S subunit